jgi:hypothetical protein
VTSPPDTPTLASLQARFGAALRSTGADADKAIGALAGCIVDDGLAPASRVQVYRNNSRAMFEGALERTYPVLRRRVGEPYFLGLAREYRVRHPSRSGDLHWIGRDFAPWLEQHLAGSEYEWLADLARLEWACEEALVSPRERALDASQLARVAPDTLADVGLELQPCLRVVRSDFPVWSVWRENQPGEAGNPVDLSQGAQHVVVTCGDEGLVLHSLPADQFGFVAALAAGAPLGDALEASGLDVERLPGVLAWLFSDGLVVALAEPGEGIASTVP